MSINSCGPDNSFLASLIVIVSGAWDIQKAIGKLPKLAGGWTLQGHKYTGPYNELENQVKYNPETGEIFEIYDQPTGSTDCQGHAT